MIGWRNLKRNKRRNLATGLAIVLSCAGLLLIGGHVLHTERYLRNVSIYLQGVGHITIYKKEGREKHFVKPNRYSLSLEDQEKIYKIALADPNVELITKYLFASGLIGNGCISVPFLGMGVIPEDEKKIRSNPNISAIAPDFFRMLKGKPLSEYPDFHEGISIGFNLERRLHKSAVYEDPKSKQTQETLPSTTNSILDCSSSESTVQISKDPNVQLAAGTFDGSFSALDGEIVNTTFTGLEDREGDFLTAHLEHFQRLYDTDKVSYISIFLKNPDDIEREVLVWEKRFKDAGLDVSVYPWNSKHISPLYVGTTTFIRTLVTVIAFIFLIVVFLAIVNSTTITVIERTREIGTLRSLGFTPKSIGMLFVAENFVLSVISVVGGLILSVICALFINVSNIRYQSPGFTAHLQLELITTWELVLCVVLMLFLVVSVTTFIVSTQRAKRNIVALLTA